MRIHGEDLAVNSPFSSLLTASSADPFECKRKSPSREDTNGHKDSPAEIGTAIAPWFKTLKEFPFVFDAL